LAFSYWFDNLGFTTEGKLVVVLIIPSSWVSQRCVIYMPSASMAGLEATVEIIQQLCNLRLVAQHVVNLYHFHNIAPLQQRSCSHWEVLSRVHPTRLHQESPSSSEIITVSNFLDGGNQKELSRPQGVRLLI
jgi:hypothetical protein